MNAFAPPVPLPDVDSGGYWEAAAQGRLDIARCATCRRWQHPPSETCRTCGGALCYEPVSGRGTVFSCIVVRQPTVPGRMPPYVVALVELEEQPGLRLSGVVQDAVEDVPIGTPVEARLARIGDSDLFGPEFAVRAGPTA